MPRGWVSSPGMASGDDSLPVPSTRSLEREWAPQFEASDALLLAVWSALPKAVPRLALEEPDGALPKVLTDLISRSITIYRAVLALCRGGFPTQAMILCRALFEDVIAAHWAVAPENRAVAAARLIDQERLADDIRARRLAEQGVSWGSDERLSEEERTRLTKQFRGGNQSWFGDRREAMKIAQASVETRGFIAEWLDTLDLLCSEGSQAVHNTVHSLERSSRGGFLLEAAFQPSYGQATSVPENEMRMAFTVASACLGLVADVVLDELGVATQVVREACVFAMNSVALSPSERRRSLGRNDLCWCGSGRKLKNCHET